MNKYHPQKSRLLRWNQLGEPFFWAELAPRSHGFGLQWCEHQGVGEEAWRGHWQIWPSGVGKTTMVRIVCNSHSGYSLCRMYLLVILVSSCNKNWTLCDIEDRWVNHAFLWSLWGPRSWEWCVWKVRPLPPQCFYACVILQVYELGGVVLPISVFGSSKNMSSFWVSFQGQWDEDWRHLRTSLHMMFCDLEGQRKMVEGLDQTLRGTVTLGDVEKLGE